MTDNNPIHSIHTPCKNCVFATYNQNTQYGCGLNYLDKYKADNLVLEAYDDEKEFYIINDKKCIGYRENSWFDKFNMGDSSMEEKIQKFYETNKLHYLAIINLRRMTLSEFDDICSQISKSNIEPQKIIFIRHQENSKNFSYQSIENILKAHNIKYKWRIQSMLDASISDREVLHNIITINPKYRFILNVDDHTNQVENMLIQTNKIVHHDLDQFSVLSTNDHRCIIFSGGVYRFGIATKQDILSNKESYQII